MLTLSLQSGSNGNSIYVEAGCQRILFDGGLSARRAQERLSGFGRDLQGCTALFISHDHSDHVRSAGPLHRRFGMPLYITEPTLQAAHRSVRLGNLSDVRHFRAGATVELGSVRIHTVPTPHDAADGVAFVVEHGGRRLGILTDLGHPFPGLSELLAGLDGAYLESNYDPDLLETGAYPPFLKARIRGGRGHLSNQQSAFLAHAGAAGRLRWLAIAHLSQDNNRPAMAIEAHRLQLGREFPIHHASRHGPGPIIEL